MLKRSRRGAKASYLLWVTIARLEHMEAVFDRRIRTMHTSTRTCRLRSGMSSNLPRTLADVADSYKVDPLDGANAVEAIDYPYLLTPIEHTESRDKFLKRLAEMKKQFEAASDSANLLIDPNYVVDVAEFKIAIDSYPFKD